MDAVTWPWQEWPAYPAPAVACDQGSRHIWLRILGTTDIHGHVLPYDYASNTPDGGFGLARIATHVKTARAQAKNTLLFDNGDYLQGSPLTDIGTRPENGWTGANPVIQAMNHVDYDAATLGNHEFNFGLDWLIQTLKQARFPLVCSNAVLDRHPMDPTQDKTLLPPFVLLDRTCLDNTGAYHQLKIGVIGVVPEQILQWDQDKLSGRLDVRDMAETLCAYIPKMRSAGAQVVVVLAHTGIGDGDNTPGQENAGLALAQIPGVDAMLTGHTHGVFPDPLGHAENPAICSLTGTLANIPAVMAGFRGSHLGVIDLKLVPQENGWHVSTHSSQTWSVQEPRAEPDTELSKLVKTAHDATLQHTSRVVGHTHAPIHSYLSQFRPELGQYLVMACKRNALERALADTAFAHLPVLSVCAPYKTGGSGGPDYYTDIPAGDLCMRNIADLYPFPNTLVGLRVRGVQLVEWLERAASGFQQVEPGRIFQPLWNPSFVGNTFDTICGVHYTINLTQPARYDQNGSIVNPDTRRIESLCYQDQPVTDSDEFVLALKSFRAFSTGMFAPPDANSLVYSGRELVRDLLVDYIQCYGSKSASPIKPSWTFLPVENASVYLDTGPGVMNHPKDIEAISAKVLDKTDRGFLRLEIPL